MIEKLKNIDTAFKHVRLFTAVLIVACFTTIGYFMWLFSQARDRIYIMSGEKVFSAFGSVRKENISVELRDHIKVFHQDFFTLSPDEKAIETSIRKALYLADNSAKEQYDDLKEKGYYAGIISGNISQRVDCDSIYLQTEHLPFSFRFYGKQVITRTTAIITRNLITEGIIRDLQERTDHNPHAFLVERWKIIDNTNINTTSR